MAVAVKVEHPQMFPRWRCLEHDCGSYNFNNLARHMFENCDIVEDVTVGIVGPRTWGGFNGDVSRKYCKDWEEICLYRENQKRLADKWDQYILKRRKEIIGMRNKGKLASKIRRVLQHKGKKGKD